MYAKGVIMNIGRDGLEAGTKVLILTWFLVNMICSRKHILRLYKVILGISLRGKKIFILLLKGIIIRGWLLLTAAVNL